jgi:hypothetical protein
MAKSPTMEGLRLVYRQPSLGLAEVAWRWTFATAASLLLCFLLAEYLDSLPVTGGDLWLLRSGLPWLVLATVQHILLSGAERFAAAGSIVLLALGMLWIFAVSAGRAATVRALLDHFQPPDAATERSPLATDLHGSTPIGSEIIGATPWRSSGSLLGVHFLRTGLLLTTLLAWIGAAILAGFASPEHDPQPGLVLLLLLGLTCLIALLWGMLDRLLSLAPIFVIRDGQDTFSAVSAAIQFVRLRRGPVGGSSALFAVIHLVIFFAASSLASVPLAFVSILPGWTIAAALLLLTLGYFAVIDFLYVARLAAYIAILGSPNRSSGPGAISKQPEMPWMPTPVPASEDDIISDIPGLVPPPAPV